MSDTIDIKINIDQIVNVQCWNSNCKNNLNYKNHGGVLACNLKHITIGRKGECDAMREDERPAFIKKIMD
jgi:hypothetical protein